jgi:hypothetical protein
MTSQARSAGDRPTPDDAVSPPSNTADPAGYPPAERIKSLPREIGGREGLDPTRYGDWEMRGRCIDF